MSALVRTIQNVLFNSSMSELLHNQGAHRGEDGGTGEEEAIRHLFLVHFFTVEQADSYFTIKQL